MKTQPKAPEWGWRDNGGYYCPCGLIIGRNLRGESPAALVAEHVRHCVPNAVACLNTRHPINPRPARYSPETWQLALREYLNPGSAGK